MRSCFDELPRRTQRSDAAEAYRALYKTGRWKRLRLWQLQREPLCAMCEKQGRVTAATIADHVIPHRGDTELFFDGRNLQSLCKAHHDGVKQSEERRGFSTEVGPDGWPSDPRHPANGGVGAKVWGYSIPHGVRHSAIPVTLVCGPPASGKTTYVSRHASPGDVVIDLDAILVYLGFEPWTSGREALAKAFAYRAQMIRGLASKTSGRAWLIVTAPTTAEREAWRKALGTVSVVTMNTDAATCLARIEAEPRRARAAARHRAAVAAWFRSNP